MYSDPVDLFEHRLASLVSFVQNPDTVRMYDAAFLIRNLILDQHSLADIVNRPIRMKLRFTVNSTPAHLLDTLAAHSSIIFAGASLSPRIADLGTVPRTLGRDQFLKEPVLLTAWHQVSVAEFLSFAANKAGGVHFDTSSDRTTDLLRRFMMPLESEELQLFGATLLAVSDVVVVALEPLLAAARQPAGRTILIDG